MIKKTKKCEGPRRVEAQASGSDETRLALSPSAPIPVFHGFPWLTCSFFLASMVLLPNRGENRYRGQILKSYHLRTIPRHVLPFCLWNQGQLEKKF